LTERQALKQLRMGSEEALGWFIHQYTPYVTTVIHNIIGTYMDISDVEEVAADVFFALWEEAELVHSPKGFLGTVARNKAKNKLRELTDNLPLNDYLLITEEDGLEARTEKKELAAAVKRSVLAMRQPDRDIFLRFYYYYQSLDEISCEMGIGLSTVKSRLRRGRAKLRQTLLRYIT
jgi:RNA polymerase sigma-70 factor (ECF subfamily)